MSSRHRLERARLEGLRSVAFSRGQIFVAPQWHSGTVNEGHRGTRGQPIFLYGKGKPPFRALRRPSSPLRNQQVGGSNLAGSSVSKKLRASPFSIGHQKRSFGRISFFERRDDRPGSGHRGGGSDRRRRTWCGCSSAPAFARRSTCSQLLITDGGEGVSQTVWGELGRKPGAFEHTGHRLPCPRLVHVVTGGEVNTRSGVLEPSRCASSISSTASTLASSTPTSCRCL